MSCVWKALIQAMSTKELALFELGSRPSPLELMKKVKKHNKKIKDILINGEKITETQSKENYDRIESIKQVNKGYLCSGCDPLLILIASITKRNIVHIYRKHRIIYRNTSSTTGNPMIFESSNSHFWARTKEC